MEFISFKACNIFSLGEVEIDLQNQGLTLVTGYSYDEGDRNGSGKSSLTSKGILWTLYGKTPSGIRADAVVNRHAKSKKSYSVLTVKDGNNLFKIFRGRHPKGLRLTKVNTQTDSFADADSDLSFKEEGATQHEINKLVGYTFEEFTRMFFFGQGLSEVFIDQPQAFKKSLVEKILPFETVEELLAKTKIVYNNYEISKSKLNFELDSLKNQLSIYEKDIFSLKRERDSEAANLAKLQSQSFDLLPEHNSIGALDALIVSLNNDLTYLQKKEIKAFKKICSECQRPLVIPGGFTPEDQTRMDQIRQTLAKVPLKKKLVEICNSNKQRWDTLINDKASKFEELKAKHLKTIDEMYTVTQSLTEVKQWQSALSYDIRISLLDLACPILTEHTNSYLQKLKNGQITVQFEVNQGNFDVKASSQTGASSFDSLSGGEQQMVNFAVGLALRSLSQFVKGDQSVPSIMIFDEPFSQLDNRNAEAVVEFLTTSDLADTILLVSNDPALMSLIPKVIKVVKRDGVSTIE